MDKMLFFNIDVYDDDPEKEYNTMKLCPVCNNIARLNIYTCFRYYHKKHSNVFSYDFHVCYKCYTDKVMGKDIKMLKNFIPIMKIKKSEFLKDNIYCKHLYFGKSEFVEKYISKNRKRDRELDKRIIYSALLSDTELKEYLNG